MRHHSGNSVFEMKKSLILMDWSGEEFVVLVTGDGIQRILRTEQILACLRRPCGSRPKTAY